MAMVETAVCLTAQAGMRLNRTVPDGHGCDIFRRFALLGRGLH